MVKVVKVPENKQTTCGFCEATLEYNYKDTFTRVEGDIYNGRKLATYINCPVCGKQTKVSGKSQA